MIEHTNEALRERAVKLGLIKPGEKVKEVKELKGKSSDVPNRKRRRSDDDENDGKPPAKRHQTFKSSLINVDNVEDE